MFVFTVCGMEGLAKGSVEEGAYSSCLSRDNFETLTKDSRENRKFISTLSPHNAIIQPKISIELKTWAAVRRSSCRPRSILIRGQHVREPDKYHTGPVW